MILSAISSALSAAIPTTSFPHRKGAYAINSTMTSAAASNTSGPLGNTSGITIGQMPVAASSPLLTHIVQSLQQTAGARGVSTVAAPLAGNAASGTGTAAAASNTAGTTANVQAFMHSLFQALNQDGLEAGASASAAAGASAGTFATGAATAGGLYQAHLVASLQTLIGQVGLSGMATPATANLSAAYQNLTGAPASSSGSGLQSFLGNLLQNLQSSGVHSLSGVGNNVNANV